MQRLSGWGLLLSVVLAVVLVGCANLPPITSAPMAANAPVYHIGPGDQLQIYVADKPNLSATVPVGPDGNIAMPLVQRVRAEGKTPERLAKDIERKLSRYVRNPGVTIIVLSFNGTYDNEVRVIGQAVKPHAIPYRAGMTLLDALTAVGGLTPYASGDRAEIIRKVNGKERVYRAHLRSLLSGNMKDNAPLQPGDVIIIPQKLF